MHDEFIFNTFLSLFFIVQKHFSYGTFFTFFFKFIYF